LPSRWPPASTIPPRLVVGALRPLRSTSLPFKSMPEAKTGAPLAGARSRRMPGPALSTILLSAMRTSSVGCPRSAARMCSPAAVSARFRPRAPDKVFRSTRRPIGPTAVMTSRCPPESVQSDTSTHAIMPPDPFVPAPMTTSRIGDPVMVR